jgi:type III pantothenate kinase
MLLVSDIGNTNITSCIYDNTEVIKKFNMPSDSSLTLFEYKAMLEDNTKNFNIDKCIIGSVSDETLKVFGKSCETVFGAEKMIILNNNSFKDLIIDTKNPDEAGIDRLANVYALKDKYKQPVIIIDMGTAVTFDILVSGNIFTGGIIMPGINIQLKSLNDYTSKLPIIKIKDIDNVIGKDTEGNILSGVILGTACAIDGLIEKCEKSLGEKAVIVGCGGHCELISKYMKRKFDFINQNLTLEGLRLAAFAD